MSKTSTQPRAKRQRAEVLKNTLAPQTEPKAPSWQTAAYTVQICAIDPCLPLVSQHTDDRREAMATWRRWCEIQDKQGGEWHVELWEHPKHRSPTRNVMTKGEGSEKFVYHAEYGCGSKMIKEFSYMDPPLKAKR